MQVDEWLQPYLQLTLTKLQTAENRLLRDELLLLVANALYYNSGATCAILQQFGALQQLFSMLFSFIFARSKKDKPAHFKGQQDKKVVVLGLLALLGLPDNALPPEIAAGLPQLLSGLIRLLVDLKTQQENAAAAAEEDEEEPEEDVDADDGDDDDAADDGQLEEDDAYMKKLRKQALKLLRGDTAENEEDSDDWTDDDEETIGSPLDDVDPFVSFADVLGGLQSAMPGRYQALIAGANGGVIAALQGMSEYAAQIKQKQAANAVQQ
eukprot:GHUV01008748.1.p1 GENE.GHUV01008748.1~~GHUV01008748.1.p1  ORF type:complete len:267 (+),score=129.68 GHUV01008748.1:211-1011(+)